MAYVDLNPIRAVMAPTPELSDYTSIQERLGIEPVDTLAEEPSGNTESLPKAELMSFAGDEHQQHSQEHLPFHFTDYLELVDWTGRIIRDDKRGHISQHLPPILQRLNLTPAQWLKASQQIESSFGRAIGPIVKLEQLTEKLDQCWLKGKGACRQLYSPSPH